MPRQSLKDTLNLGGSCERQRCSDIPQVWKPKRHKFGLSAERTNFEERLEELDRENAKDVDDEKAQSVARIWTHFATDGDEKANRRRGL